MKRRIKICLFLVSLILMPIGLYIGACLLGGSSLRDTFVFLGRFIAEPQSVGAVAPSSQKLAAALSLFIKPSADGRSRHILEVGPGTGSVTQEIVKRLSPGDKLDIVELDEKMASMLREKYLENKQVEVVAGSITTWKPEYQYELVVVGIPFNALPFGLVKEIWEHVVAMIAPGGVLSYFAYIGLPHIKSAFLTTVARKEFKKIQRYLKGLYYKNGIKKRNVWSNVPPARVRYLRFN